MSIGPQPNLGSALFSGPDSSPSSALDANGDVTDPDCPPPPGSGGGSGSCGSSGGGSGGADPNDDPVGGPMCWAPPGTGGCVLPNTRIALFPEGCIPAWEVEKADLLLTRCADGELVGEAVTDIRVSEQPCVVVETSDGRQLRCSLSHEVMVHDETCLLGRRTRVSSLTLADRLLLQDGTPIGIEALIPQPPGKVIQISLSGPNHLYLSEGIWSHNKVKIAWPTAGS